MIQETFYGMHIRVVIPLALFFMSAMLLHLPGVSAQQLEYDLAISGQDISFVPARLLAGQRVRIYASVRNTGTKDNSAYVTFYQGATLIGDSQPISLRAGGLADEVFVDFTVPNGSFNIRAEIKGASPKDENPQNDTALTKLFTPEPDADGDGITDAEDNCPKVSNLDQKDTDGDKQGDACDDDDDNDGITDVDELKAGTNALKADTDGDGVGDKEDAYPLDASRTKVPPPPPAPTPVPAKKMVVQEPPPLPITQSPLRSTSDVPLAVPQKTVSLPKKESASPVVSTPVRTESVIPVVESKAVYPSVGEEMPSPLPADFLSFRGWPLKVFVGILAFASVVSFGVYLALRRKKE